MPAIDFKKELKQLYQPGNRGFEVVEVPSLQFLMIDGYGDPNTEPAYRQAIEALYAAAYKLKFMSKKQAGQEYVVPPLEGLWWAQDMEVFTATRDKSRWDWTMMIMQPGWITPAMSAEAIRQAAKGKDLPALPRLRLEWSDEGLAAQILYTGADDDEGPTIARLHHEFLPQNGYEPAGKHHEIYLSDPRRVAPDKLRTVIRQPVRKKAS